MKIGVIGTPDDAIAQIAKLQAKQASSGSCRTYNNIADWRATSSTS